MLNYLKAGGDNSYAAMARLAGRREVRRLNPFDALVFIRKVPGSPGLYEMLPETIVADYDVSNI